MEKQWVGVGNPFDMDSETYEIQKQKNSVKVLPFFKDIKNLKNVKENLDFLDEHIQSPTSCYFDVDEKTGEFYHDQQGCVVWYF